MGLANQAHWYPFSFSFRSTHYAVAWIAIGSLVVHIAVKLPIIRRAWAGPLPEPELEPESDSSYAGPSRRTILRTALLASGVAVLAAAGNTVPWLRRISVFAVRDGEGPQGVPINRSAVAAGVTETARAADFEVTLLHGDREVALTRAQLESMTQRTESLPIACVEGWSASATWSGVRFSELLDLVEAPQGRQHQGDLAADQGRVRGHPDPGLVRPRPADAARTAAQRRRPDDRPRLPVPADRAQPSGRVPDQVGHRAGGAVVRTRLLIGGVGVLMGAFGALRFLQLDLDDIVNAVLFLAGGVIVHDGFIAPLTVALVFLLTRVVPGRMRTAVTMGLVVLGTVTVTAIPVLGGFGARPDNLTVLPRNYVLGWFVFAALVLVVTGVAALRAPRKHDEHERA